MDYQYVKVTNTKYIKLFKIPFLCYWKLYCSHNSHAGIQVSEDRKHCGRTKQEIATIHTLSLYREGTMVPLLATISHVPRN